MDYEPLCFTHDDREFTVKASRASDGWKVRLYENDKLVTNLVYSVSYETVIDAKTIMNSPKDLVRCLMETCKSDIEKGIVNLSE